MAEQDGRVVRGSYAFFLPEITSSLSLLFRLPHFIFLAERQSGHSSSLAGWSSSKSRSLVAKSTTLDKYEGKSETESSKSYLDPDKKATDDSDVKYEHPADLERPQFHPMGKRGFVSDPCGPFYDPKHER